MENRLRRKTEHLSKLSKTNNGKQNKCQFVNQNVKFLFKNYFTSQKTHNDGNKNFQCTLNSAISNKN